MPRAERFQTLIHGRFERNATRIAKDMLKQALQVWDTGDAVIVQEVVENEIDFAQYRLDLATDSAAWQGFEVGRFTVMEEQEALIHWVLEPRAEHCPTCLAFAAGGPYTAATLPGIPAQANTECNGSCRCNLEMKAA